MTARTGSEVGWLLLPSEAASSDPSAPAAEFARHPSSDPSVVEPRMATKADSRVVREMNRALVLDLLRREGSITRSDLARRSALAKPTVSDIVDALLEEGIVREVGPGASHSRGGARGRLVGLNAAASAFVGIHFGVDRTALAVADALGRIRATRTIAPFRDDAGRALHDLPEIVAEVMRDAQLPRTRLRGAGIAVPGLINYATGTCVLAPNLGWRDVPLRTKLAEAFRVPVAVRNSVQAGAIAEARLGSVGRSGSFAWVYVGTGVGAAIVIDGHVFYGKRGYTGELGHWRVADDAAPCACGRTGCLETVASSNAIESAWRALRSEKVQITESAGHAAADRPKKLDAHGIVLAANAGDQRARSIVSRAGRHLGVAISHVLNLLDLERVVLDGPVIRAGGYFIETIRASVAAHTVHGQGALIVQSTVVDGILKGAVFLAMEGDLVDGPGP